MSMPAEPFASPAVPRLGSVCVFTGARAGTGLRYREAAAGLGRTLARRGIDLVYGGAQVGLMGAMADAALAAGGRVVGVMPQGLFDLEVVHRGLDQLIVTADMSSRKARMAELADAFLAMPGGYGTLDELFEVVTWAQLGLHRKPVGLMDCGGFWSGLLGFLAHVRAEGFIPDTTLAELPCHEDPERILDLLATMATPGAAGCGSKG